MEVDIGGGLPSFTIVGLPDAAVRESRERVRSALRNSGFRYPDHRITVNLAPADVRKAGPGFDLAIAAAILAATGQLPRAVRRQLRDGRRAGARRRDPARAGRPGDGGGGQGLGAARRRGSAGRREPGRAGRRARGDAGRARHPAARAGRGRRSSRSPRDRAAGRARTGISPISPICAAIPALRRCLEIAAAGAHSLLLIGPPGGGKTLALQRLPSLLPPLSANEVIEVTRIAGVCGENGGPRLHRPFRAPHHTVSGRALVGGGAPPRPGEVTRAHRGVLFLDELGEFRRDALEALRVPLEDGAVTVTRTTGTVSLPCRFMLVAASNPCPCGNGPDSGECDCHPGAVSRYMAKLSGALADRIDITLTVDPPPPEELRRRGGGLGGGPGAGAAARAAQEERLGPGPRQRGDDPGEVHRHCGSMRRRGGRSTRAIASSASAPAAGTAACGWRGRSPTSPARSGSAPSTSPRRSRSAGDRSHERKPRACGAACGGPG